MRLLDLFCKAGGASMGYHRAGFEVVGVDIEPQRRYPFEFQQCDAIAYAKAHGHEFDVIVASPPCQRHSSLKGLALAHHLDLIAETREVLIASGLPYVIENVVGAPLIEPLTLCGSMFGLGVGDRILKRHRLFESDVPLVAPHACACRGRLIGGVYGMTGGERQHVRGYRWGVDNARAAMGIEWMTGLELGQAIPPAYTEHIGRQLVAHLARSPTTCATVDDRHRFLL